MFVYHHLITITLTYAYTVSTHNTNDLKTIIHGNQLKHLLNCQKRVGVCRQQLAPLRHVHLKKHLTLMN